MTEEEIHDEFIRLGFHAEDDGEYYTNGQHDIFDAVAFHQEQANNNNESAGLGTSVDWFLIHSFRTSKLGFRTNGGELFGGNRRNGVYLHRNNIEAFFSKR